jgi:hypothetical protein
VGAATITGAEFQAEAERQRSVSEVLVDAQPFLQRLIDRQALATAAAAQGLDRDPEFRRQCQNLLIGMLRQRHLEPALAAVAVSDLEITAFYKANEDRYRISGSIRLALLRLQCRPDRQAETKAQLEAVRAQVAALDGPATGFGALAIANSDHQASRYQGGDIGWLHDRKGPAWLPPAVVTAAWELANPGQTSEILVDERAVFLLRLLDRKDPGTRPLADVAPAIRSELLAGKRREAEEVFVRQARDAVTVTVQQAALAEAVKHLRDRVGAATSEPKPPPPLP